MSEIKDSRKYSEVLDIVKNVIKGTGDYFDGMKIFEEKLSEKVYKYWFSPPYINGMNPMSFTNLRFVNTEIKSMFFHENIDKVIFDNSYNYSEITVTYK